MTRRIRAAFAALIAAVALIATASNATSDEPAASDSAAVALTPDAQLGSCSEVSAVTQTPQVRCPWFKAASKVVFNLSPGDNPPVTGYQMVEVVGELEDRAPVLGNLIVGDCQNHPTAPCIKVYKINNPDVGWSWQISVDPNASPRSGYIKFNAANDGENLDDSCATTARIWGLTGHTDEDAGGGCTLVPNDDARFHVGEPSLVVLRDAYRHN